METHIAPHQHHHHHHHHRHQQKQEQQQQNQSAKSFENVLEVLGVPGKYQVMQTALILTCKTIVTFSLMSFVFMGYEPPHVCNNVNETKLLEKYGLVNETTAWIHYDSCHISIYTNVTTTTTTNNNSSRSNNNNNNKQRITEIDKIVCPNGRNFSDAKHVSFLSEWDLVCDSRGTAELVETIAMVGSMISGVFSTTLADRFGRKPFFVTCILMVCVLETVVIFAPSIYMIMGVRLFSGFFAQGVVCCYFVMGIELVIPRHRQTQGIVYVNVWVIHVLLLGGIGYIWKDGSWRYLQGTIAASGVSCLLLPFFLHESPRWLALNNRKKRVLKVLELASRKNGTSFEAVKMKLDEYWNDNTKKDRLMVDVGDMNHGDETVVKEKDNGFENKEKEEVKEEEVENRDDGMKRDQASLMTLLRNKRLLRMTFLTWFIWTSHSATYFGLFMTSTDITGNRFLNYALMTLVEVPSNFLILFLMNKMKRKSVLMMFLSLTTVFLMASSLLLTFGEDSSTTNVLSTVFFISGKFTISASFNVLYIMTPELYPTNLRSIGNGINTSSSLGSMLAPFSRPLFTIAKWAPGLIFTVMCLVSLVMVTGLPETKGVNLPNHADDLRRVKDKTKKKKKSFVYEIND